MSAPEEGETPKRELDAPGCVEDLYYTRGEDVDELRPICQGDVYRGLQMPGFDEDELLILIGHPCSLRKGAALRPRLQASPIRAYEKVPLRKWTGHGRVLPLPELVEGSHVAADLTETGVVQSADLPGTTRVATLSKSGILFLQQRIIYTLAHAVVGLDTLEEFNALALDEIELLEGWNEALCGHLSDAELHTALGDTANRFEEFMKPGPRARLAEAATRGEARTMILAEARRLRVESAT
ncbi:MAG TPA: hypothetical protein VGN13_10555 [Solirubrobacteraceae bacterium]|jgi:hypothetical protein